MTNPVDIPVEALWVHPTCRRNPSPNIDALAESIATIGLLKPVVATKDGLVLAGQRRLAAYRHLGRSRIPTLTAECSIHAVSLLIADRDVAGVEQTPKTVSELVALGAVVEDLARGEATVSLHSARVRGGKHRWSKQADVPQETQETSTQRVGCLAAAAIGMGGSTYYKAKYVVSRAASEDPTIQRIAEAALSEMDRTGNITRAYNKVRQAATPGQQPAGVRDPGEQRRLIATAVATLSGISLGLRQIGSIHPGITKEEAAQWLSGLSESRRAIASLIKHLEGTNANT